MSSNGKDYCQTSAYDLLNTNLHQANLHIFALTKNLYTEMLLDDIHSVAGYSFEIFGQNLGLPEKVITQKLNFFRTPKPQVQQMIENRGLPEHLAISYYQGYEYRRKTLSFT